MSECMTQEDAMNMNNEQAIQILKPLRDMMRDQYGCPISDAFFALNKAIEALSAQPQRKTGRWISEAKGKTATLDEFGNVSCSAHCSECGDWLTASDEYDCRGRFCPNCGAKMEVEHEDR